ncbi:tRNA (adenosine(37)-N6)-dimethylallyltransferase MiaA [Carnobacterium pleistocenium]|uniref:tRNA (adenosine(37)-N6)-dimethylallyltransferase MiaA n=1 Tax=Carnobacterium pleistocenium TaxID=181073 RepID=UPI00054F7745|nr:tRNA (adenosine(37)-N6)-dimethylallyltransferase MiaA [Carnobacterium pleistocenium]
MKEYSVENKKIIIIVGPTAVGKTSLSVSLAEAVNGEIISGDSMQIYRDLSIGTAKVTKDEQKGIPHYLIDEVDVTTSYAVSDFQKRARFLIEDISARGKVPIIVGGTGLYIESLLYDVSFGGSGKNDLAFREAQEASAIEKGNLYLWEQLAKIDVTAAESIHFNNRRRIIRALEVHHVTGQLFSSYQNERKEKELLYEAKIIGLTTEREVLYERINLRVEQMFEAGLIEEAKWLYQQNLPDAQASRGIGYKELIPYFEKKTTLQEAKEAIQQNSRRYAKRQLTWFRNRLENVEWWDLVAFPESEKKLKHEVARFLTK